MFNTPLIFQEMANNRKQMSIKTQFLSLDDDHLKQPFPEVNDKKCPLWPHGWNVIYIFHNFIIHLKNNNNNKLTNAVFCDAYKV